MILGACLPLIAMLWSCGPPTSTIDSDEAVRFFPTYGFRASPTEWTLRIHGWIYEPEGREQMLRRGAAFLELDDAEAIDKDLAAARLSLFLVDNERNESIVIRIGKRDHELNRSRPDGHFDGTLPVADQELDHDELSAGWTTFRAAAGPGETRSFLGSVQLIEPRGASVISDIDDTLRIANVRDSAELLANTLARPYRAVPGMAGWFARSAENRGVTFHYVSGTPWQLAGVVEEFLRDSGFPQGSLHLRSFRVTDPDSVEGMLASPEETKRAAIEAILADFPHRTFVLVGDSSERDPELYGDLARRHPGQIVRIVIRELGAEPAGRYERAFEGVPPGLWAAFREPGQGKLIPE